MIITVHCFPYETGICQKNQVNTSYSLQWRHNDRDGVSNHRPHHCLLNSIFRRRSKITGLCAKIVFHLMTSSCYFSISHDDVIKWKHCPRYWPFVRGIPRSVNNGEAGDLRRHRAHYDINVMIRSYDIDCVRKVDSQHSWWRTSTTFAFSVLYIDRMLSHYIPGRRWGLPHRLCCIMVENTNMFLCIL